MQIQEHAATWSLHCMPLAQPLDSFGVHAGKKRLPEAQKHERFFGFTEVHTLS